ncbi:hypothetical protein CEXT_461151 [Caerostris extrusa]|uniref:Uncharacterized protein n=1 Tax=Caerostris extrusa TaxID=172846 RepID=A0AAV4SLM5_CAEEX|nr:hypothetical protein CEXT_461151 [Caerostris extrusa]
MLSHSRQELWALRGQALRNPLNHHRSQLLKGPRMAFHRSPLFQLQDPTRHFTLNHSEDIHLMMMVTEGSTCRSLQSGIGAIFLHSRTPFRKLLRKEKLVSYFSYHRSLW